MAAVEFTVTIAVGDRGQRRPDQRRAAASGTPARLPRRLECGSTPSAGCGLTTSEHRRAIAAAAADERGEGRRDLT